MRGCCQLVLVIGLMTGILESISSEYLLVVVRNGSLLILSYVYRLDYYADIKSLAVNSDLCK